MSESTKCLKQLEDCFYEAKAKMKDEKVPESVQELCVELECVMERLISEVEKCEVGLSTDNKISEFAKLVTLIGGTAHILKPRQFSSADGQNSSDIIGRRWE